VLRILVLMNGWRDKNARGGDYRTLRVLRTWNKEHRISLILPMLGYEFAKKFLPGQYSIYLSQINLKKHYLHQHLFEPIFFVP